MSPEDERLVAALTVLRDQLSPIVDAILFGDLTVEDRRYVARALHTLADALDAAGQLPASDALWGGCP